MNRFSPSIVCDTLIHYTYTHTHIYQVHSNESIIRCEDAESFDVKLFIIIIQTEHKVHTFWNWFFGRKMV